MSTKDYTPWDWIEDADRDTARYCVSIYLTRRTARPVRHYYTTAARAWRARESLLALDVCDRVVCSVRTAPDQPWRPMATAP